MVLWATSLMIFLVVVFLNLLSTRRRSQTNNAETLGYFVGTCITSFGLGLLVAFVYRKARRKKQSPPWKAFLITSIALLSALLSFAGSRSNQSTPDNVKINARVGELLRESAGQAPQSPDQGPWEEPVREFFHDLLEFNRQYAADVAQLKTDSLPPMYSASSYASGELMRKRIDHLNKTISVDQKYSSLQPLITKMESRLDAMNMTQAEKNDIRQGFVNGLQGSLAAREKVFDSEQKWIAASIDLYQFTLADRSDFSVKDAKLVFRNGDSKEFSDKQSRAIQLKNDFLTIKRDFDARATDVLSTVGVKRSDLTGKSDSQPPNH